MVSDDKKVAEILHDYFVIITASLEISEVEENLTKTDKIWDPVDIAVNAYKRHPSTGVAPGIFRRGGLTLPTKGLKYGFQGTINAKNLRKNAFHLPTGGYHAPTRGYSPLSLPWRHSCPNIQLIKQWVTVTGKFSFQHVSTKEILSKLKNLDPTKASPFGSIPMKIFIEHSDLFAPLVPLVQFFINESIDTGKFPKESKKGDITSIFKNGTSLLKRITGQ